MTKKRIDKRKFADFLKEMNRTIGMKMSARGWAYALEGIDTPQIGMVSKAHFDYIEGIINDCRKAGYLPVDFVAQEEARGFSGVETPTEEPVVLYLKRFLDASLRTAEIYTPEWWDGENHYIQMVVEKIDLKSLFSPICEVFHIPIATSKGWSSIYQRAEYAHRFKEAEASGLRCVLLYCGDHDPDGLRISEFLRSNLKEIANITWSDGTEGYDPTDLTIDRFGLNYDFIIENNLTWIDDLITGSKKNLASPSHPNHYMEYVQNYLRDIGERKCEANALVKQREKGRQLCREVITKYLGYDAEDRFEEKRQVIRDELNTFFERSGLDQSINKAIAIIKKEYGET